MGRLIGRTCNVISPGPIPRVDESVSKAFSHVADNRQQFEDHGNATWGNA